MMQTSKTLLSNSNYLKMTNTPAEDWSARLSEVPRSIGRGMDAGITIPSQFRSVSRKHAKVWYERQCCWISDLNSTYGTWVNGVRLIPERSIKIHHSDRISLGSLELTLIDENQINTNAMLDDLEPGQDTDDTIRLMKGVRSLPDPRLLDLPTLSHSERDVVLWAARGLTRPEDIGKMLHRSPNTVRTQFNSIFQKLGVHSRDELVGFLLRGSSPEIDIIP
jgi:DNA-binding CsgD family transcriptional regulator